MAPMESLLKKAKISLKHLVSFLQLRNILCRSVKANPVREFKRSVRLGLQLRARRSLAAFGQAETMETIIFWCGGTGVFDHDAALDGEGFVQGKAVSPLLRRSATALPNALDQRFSIVALVAAGLLTLESRFSDPGFWMTGHWLTPKGSRFFSPPSQRVG
jgi:hypothetical protein